MTTLKELLSYKLDEIEDKLRADEAEIIPVRVYTKNGNELVEEFGDFRTIRDGGEITIILKEIE